MTIDRAKIELEIDAKCALDPNAHKTPCYCAAADGWIYYTIADALSFGVEINKLKEHYMWMTEKESKKLQKEGRLYVW